ncbi:MAG: hypothetical protein ACNS62_23960 [Candidatus Cyclobacteriaceae bacterium M3_2C_046]
MNLVKTENREKLIKIALILSFITIFYNVAEGIISTFFGAEDETLALFGFGMDSFVEVISGLGIAHMIWRMNQNGSVAPDKFEKQALRITGVAFYLLTAGLVIGAIINIYLAEKPESTLVGIIISGISIITMYFLYQAKLQVGYKLDSAPIVSDAKCTKTCFYLSFILLGSSVAYELLNIPYIDAIGSLGIAWYAFKEGKEAFEKVKSGKLTCSDDCCH